MIFHIKKIIIFLIVKESGSKVKQNYIDTFLIYNLCYIRKEIKQRLNM